jgi:predicted Zn finger-like uncharacterized protein
MLTRCPNCATTFRLRPEQLGQAEGRVRCGKCNFAFSAIDQRIDADPDEQPPAPPASAETNGFPPLPPASPHFSVAGQRKRFVAQPGPEEEAEPKPVSDDLTPSGETDARGAAEPELPPSDETPTAAAAAAESLPGSEAPAQPQPELPAQPNAASDTGASAQPPEPTPAAPAEADQSAADYKPPPQAAARRDALPDDIADALAESADDDHGDNLPTATVAGADYLAEAAPARRWPWLLSLLLLAAALLLQLGYAYRTELAKHYPDLRPDMEAACERLGCSVELPREADRISIESSDLNPESDKNRLQLAATLKNRAPYAQSYPHLELTLTDVRDQPLVRRVFTPAEYLPKDAPASFAPEAEAPVRLMLEVADTNASGYRLYLFYP